MNHDARHGWNKQYVDLTVEQCMKLMQTERCHWCNCKLRYTSLRYKNKKKKQMNPSYMTFDRIFSDMPHHYDNMVAACWRCNCRVRKNLI